MISSGQVTAHHPKNRAKSCRDSDPQEHDRHELSHATPPQRRARECARRATPREPGERTPSSGSTRGTRTRRAATTAHRGSPDRPSYKEADREGHECREREERGRVLSHETPPRAAPPRGRPPRRCSRSPRAKQRSRAHAARRRSMRGRPRRPMPDRRGSRSVVQLVPKSGPHRSMLRLDRQGYMTRSWERGIARRVPERRASVSRRAHHAPTAASSA